MRRVLKTCRSANKEIAFVSFIAFLLMSVAMVVLEVTPVLAILEVFYSFLLDLIIIGLALAVVVSTL